MALCAALSINGQWLLTGEGPMKTSDTARHALFLAKPEELLAAVASSLNALTKRLDRLESTVRELEGRVLGRPASLIEIREDASLTSRNADPDHCC